MKVKKIKIGLLFLVTTLLMQSCSSGDNDVFSLVGKTYAHVTDYDAFGPYDSYSGYDVIRFTSETTIECAYRKNGIHGSLLAGSTIVNGTYTLNYPQIHLEYDDPVMPSRHVSMNAIFIDRTCFRRSDTGAEYVLQ